MAYSFIIQPGAFHSFESEDDLIEKCKEWSLLSDKASKLKTFYYKGNGMNVPCSIIGYVDQLTAVIQFDDTRHCIHPSYLKEMQASSYGVKATAAAEEEILSEDVAVITEDEAILGVVSEQVLQEVTEEVVQETEKEPKQTVDKVQSEPKAKATKSKKPKIELPEEKVKMRATVKEFTTVPNHFSDNDDEVIIYGDLTIVDTGIEVGDAWSSHSATLKKHELEIGDVITFDAKIVAKKLTKHPVPYKINNPAKLQKEV